MLYVPLLVVIAVARIKKGLFAYAALVGPLSSVHPCMLLQGLRLMSAKRAALHFAQEMRHLF